MSHALEGVVKRSSIPNEIVIHFFSNFFFLIHVFKHVTLILYTFNISLYISLIHYSQYICVMQFLHNFYATTIDTKNYNMRMHLRSSEKLLNSLSKYTMLDILFGWNILYKISSTIYQISLFGLEYSISPSISYMAKLTIL
jgi:hypothetical protein